MSNGTEEPKPVFVYHRCPGISSPFLRNLHNCRYGIVSRMVGIVGIAALFGCAVLVAAADALLKQMSASGGFYTAMLNPWMIVVCLLYFIQILLALYVFIEKGNLAIFGNIFIVFYSVLTVVLGIILFGEHLTMWQGIGIALALAGAVLINSGF